LLSVPNQSNENAEDAETPKTQRLDLHFHKFDVCRFDLCLPVKSAADLLQMTNEKWQMTYDQ